MASRLAPWLVLSGIAFILLVASFTDTTETAVPAEDPNSTAPQPDAPEIGPLQSASEALPKLPFAVFLLLASIGGAVAVWFLADLDGAQRTTLAWILVMAVIAVSVSLSDWYDPEDAGEERRDDFVIPLTITIGLFAGSMAVILMTGMDGFSQGAIVLVDVIQLFVLWGWLGIPGGRSFVALANVALGMWILVAAAVLFYQFQEKRAQAPTSDA